MDLTIIISVILLVFIVTLEFVSLFHSKSCNENILDYAVTIPLLPDDVNLSVRLDCLSEKIACGQCHADEIILIDFGATSEQLAMCRRFCLEYPCTVIVSSKEEEIKKIFSEIFAIETEK